VRSAAGALELAEDALLVAEQVAEQSVAVAFLRREAALSLGAEDARCEVGGQSGDVALIGGGEFDQSCEVRAEGVKRGDVGKAELSQRVLDDVDSRAFVAFAGLRRVDRLDDFVDV
jgi:hypothetical protein